jgi:hypothetical protein
MMSGLQSHFEYAITRVAERSGRAIGMFFIAHQGRAGGGDDEAAVLGEPRTG